MQKRASGAEFKILPWFLVIFDWSETSLDWAKTCLACQQDQPLPKPVY